MSFNICLIIMIMCVIAYVSFRYLYVSDTKVSIETFMPGPCPNCGKRTKLQCFDCGSCGWCTTPDGYGECVPGGPNGPLFRKDCINWQYFPRAGRHNGSIGPARRRWFRWPFGRRM